MRSAPRSPRTPRALLALATTAALVLAPSAALAGERPSDDARSSGRDRSVEPGRSGTPGAAASDPDEDGRDRDRTDDSLDRADGDTPTEPTATTPAGEDAAPQPTRDDSDGGGQQTAEAGSATTTATFACTSVSVTSTRDLSNVVLVFADGDVQRFEGLSGHAGTFAGTDDHAGERIVRVYVKSGDNASGEGPGYGARHDSDAACVAATTADAATTQAATTAPFTSSAPVTDATVPGDVAAAGTTAPKVGPAVVTAVEGGVLGARIDRPALAAAGGEAGVAAAGFSIRPAALPLLGMQLPRTGTEAGAYALAAILALGGGALAVRRSRTA